MSLCLTGWSISNFQRANSPYLGQSTAPCTGQHVKMTEIVVESTILMVAEFKTFTTLVNFKTIPNYILKRRGEGEEKWKNGSKWPLLVPFPLFSLSLRRTLTLLILIVTK